MDFGIRITIENHGGVSKTAVNIIKKIDDNSFKWQTVPEFVEGISHSLQLPDVWTSWKSRGQQLRCADFQMTVSIVAEGPSFRVLDENAEETLLARRKAKEEQSSDEDSSEPIMADRQNKIYYPKVCPPENEIKESDRVIFRTTEDAEKARYKRGKRCTCKANC